MKHKWKRIVSGTMAAILMASACGTSLLPGRNLTAEAMQRPGTAPYINTWLVAGPSDHSITEEIYGQAPSSGHLMGTGLRWQRFRQVLPGKPMYMISQKALMSQRTFPKKQ